MSIKSIAHELDAKLLASPDATIEYKEYQFSVSEENYEAFVQLVQKQSQTTKFSLEPIVTFLEKEDAEFWLSAWEVNLKVKDNVAIETRKKLKEVDNTDQRLIVAAAKVGSTPMFGHSKKITWSDGVRTVEIQDDFSVIEPPFPSLTNPLGGLDDSYLRWVQMLESETYTAIEQVITIHETNEGAVVLTFSSTASSENAVAASIAFDKKHNWRPTRMWTHSLDEVQVFIQQERVWLYEGTSHTPAISYESEKRGSNATVTLKEFTSWVSSCEENVDLRLPPRYSHTIYEAGSNERTNSFHEVSYLESVPREDLLIIAIAKVKDAFGTNDPECDYVMDGIVDERDLIKIEKDLVR